MRVLFLTGHLPFPPLSGGRRREYELLRRVGGRAEIHVCAVSKTPDEDARNAGALADHAASVRVFEAAGAGPIPSHDEDPWLVRRHRSPQASAFVEEGVREARYDLIHVEGFYLMDHVPTWCPLPTLLVEQNVEFLLWRQRIRTTRRRQDRLARLLEYLRTMHAEVAAWRRSTLCAALTEEDRSRMAETIPDHEVILIPNGIDGIPEPVPGEPVAPALPRPLVVFAANLAYEPNVDAATVLCREIMPRVRRRVPEAHLLVVGNDPPPEVRALGSDHIEVMGRVPAIRPYLEAADVIACPLRVGGGVKVKVLEALAAGKAVVTTPVGAQGLGEVDGALRIAERPAAFARAVVEVLQDPEERLRLERAAARYATGLPTWDEAARTLLQVYERLTADSQQRPTLAS